MSDHAGQLDTDIEIVTPENIAFRYRVAGPFRRFPAFLIDELIRLGAAIALGLVLLLTLGMVGLGQLGVGIWLTIWFVLSWFYGGLFEALWNGQTPGKRMLGLRVLSVEGQPITGWQAVLRNVLRLADGPFYIYLPGLVAAAMNDRFQRLGDLASGTVVVIEEGQPLYGLARIHEPEAIALAQAIPLGFQVNRTLARTLSAYVSRRQSFAWSRRAEIARHLGEPLRQRFNLPPNTSHDLLLCALYHRTFVAEHAAA